VARASSPCESCTVRMTVPLMSEPPGGPLCSLVGHDCILPCNHRIDAGLAWRTVNRAEPPAGVTPTIAGITRTIARITQTIEIAMLPSVPVMRACVSVMRRGVLVMRTGVCVMRALVCVMRAPVSVMHAPVCVMQRRVPVMRRVVFGMPTPVGAARAGARKTGRVGSSVQRSAPMSGESCYETEHPTGAR
jgi:hypothetical protein